MLLHLIYIIAFTILAVLAVGNLIRNLMTLGMESQRYSPPRGSTGGAQNLPMTQQMVPHPEFLDEFGNVINEPLLVMRSMTVEDARDQLDALYEASPGPSNLNNLNGESREEP
ncbi:MAG: DUF2973 domain-containing protein [Leptolyngbyaceae cyanobacterium RU_5_1]|nr:DUF2973 domain-containing protein [Leptolyngbyaceae cyanobacterium RU_5_1]